MPHAPVEIACLGDWWRGGDLRGSRGDLWGSPRDLERGMGDLRGVPGDPGGAKSEGEVSGRVLRQHTVSLLFPQPGRLVARMGSKGLPGRPPGITKRSREGHEGSTGWPGGPG
eukprot:gene15654-biopygen1150